MKKLFFIFSILVFVFSFNLFAKDVLDFLKKNGRGYQSVINSILRTYYEAHR